MGPEQAIQKQILDLLAVKARGGGLFFSKVHTGAIKTRNGHARNPMKGFPDILIFYHGQGICIEVKTPEAAKYNRKKDADQREMRERLSLAGVKVLRVDSPDDVAVFFAQYDAQMSSEAAVKELREVWR